jgi:hypothetical protein
MEIPGLAGLVRNCSHYSAIHLDVLPHYHLYRPMVDEVLRRKIGLDFATAIAVQRYIRQLLETSKGGRLSEGLKANRRKLRCDIVVRAQEIWESVVLNGGEEGIAKTGDAAAKKKAVSKMMVVYSRERWAPTSIIPKFLFPDRLLFSSQRWLPYDGEEQWLTDPTLGLETSRDVLRVGADWVDQKAKDMLQQLIAYETGGLVTTWNKAAEEWHTQRLKLDLLYGKYLNLDLGGKRLKEPAESPTLENNRLDVIAKKLRIDASFPVGTLNDHEKRMAVGCFNKIIRQRCSGCPQSNHLILPCGLEAIVRHYREYHPYSFFLSNKWTIRG